MPLQQLSECVCKGSMHDYRTFVFEERCGCPEGFFMNGQVGECQPCQQMESCAWNGNPTLSRKPPSVQAGFWVPCIPEESMFAGYEIFHCSNKHVCLGSAHGNCAEEQCAEGREGFACARCRPGYTGQLTGPCSPCNASPRKQLAIVLTVSTVVGMPALVYLIHITTVPKRRRFVRLVRKLKIVCRQFIKNMQGLDVIAHFSVRWPHAVQKCFDWVSVLTVQIGLLVDLPVGLGCVFEQHSATTHLLTVWLAPLFFVTLAAIAAMGTQLLAKLFPRFLAWILIRFDDFLVFIFMVWSCFLSVSQWRVLAS